ncbi:MAG: A/G-specific adenine glycosylase [Myxococcales bacterium]|nr:A/G-specific adenine glycosylase [Myxococcales bacterium]
MSAEEIGRLRAALLGWYDGAKRDLPWRERAGDPYAVWVSEVMLQQTRVDTVLPYYARFLERFPTLRALAEAREDEVMGAWSGLGYYRRARLLHSGVREVVARYGGEVPVDPEARRSLPGVGRYTAGALGSVCFGLEEPIVDGNVARILTRIFGIASPLPERETQKRLWALAEALVVGERPGDFNQAMMELGALVCTVKRPKCDACPARDACVARAEGTSEQLPLIPRKTPPQRAELVAVVATRGERVVMVRGDDALFGGLYGLPMTAVDAPGTGPAPSSGADTPDAVRHNAARLALASAGVSGRLGREPVAPPVSHVLSHRRLTVHVYGATHARLAEAGSGRLLEVDAHGVVRTPDVGIARLTHKVLEAARSAPRSAR